MTKNKKGLKTSLSPVIYNNGNKNIVINFNNKEVFFMQDELIINNELKKAVLSDEEILQYLNIYLLHTFYKSENPKEYSFIDYGDFRIFKSLLYDNTKAIDSTSLKNQLTDVINDALSNDMLNEAIQDYTNISVTEGKNLINTLSQLLYMQNKHKDDRIGQEIDKKIKEWIKYINEWNNGITEEQEKDEEIKINKNLAHILYRIIPSLNYDIYYNDENRANYNGNRDYIDLFSNPLLEQKDLKENIKAYISNKLKDSAFYNRLNTKIKAYIEQVRDSEIFDKFVDDKEDKLKEINKKYKITKKQMEKELKKENLYSVKDIIENNIPNANYINELFNEYDNYLKDNNLIYDDTEDRKIWTKKSDEFINNLIKYNGKVYDINFFNINYALNGLAYSEYQIKNYKIDKETTEEEKNIKKPRLSQKELKEKYKKQTLLNDEILNYDRKFARLDTNKVNTNIMDLREQIANKTKSNTNLTIKKIKEIEKIPKPSKEDLAKLKELKQLLKQQQEEQQEMKNEINELQDDINLINKQILDTTDPTQRKTLTRKSKKMQKELKNKETLIKNEGFSLQQDLFTNKFLVAEKENKRTKENYKLMINSDYDIQNFNSEGRNFLYYIPNIPNIINELDEDFITIDIKDYLNFTGRNTGNISRIRTNLQNALKEMRKESYDYTYLDDKGVLHDDSLILIGDIKGTEYKGLASVKVQLGATFKDNLKETFIKNQYIKVNSDVFKIGQGKNNKVEKQAKEIFLYLAKLCRIEAKNQVNNGVWVKDIHLDTIITKLCELNLLKYDPNRYNECVKEPLLYALNIGMELGYFKYETNAFDYYDKVIASNNNGANVQDKIKNFEKGKEYGIRFYINGDMIDLEKNTKANKTYNKYKNKYKTTKK